MWEVWLLTRAELAREVTYRQHVLEYLLNHLKQVLVTSTADDQFVTHRGFPLVHPLVVFGKEL